MIEIPLLPAPPGLCFLTMLPFLVVMDQSTLLQGRLLSQEDLAQIKKVLADHPNWSRWRVSREIAQSWNWRTAMGQIKDMAARSLLIKLEQRQWITLPPRRKNPSLRRRLLSPETPPQGSSLANSPITESLLEIQPLVLKLVKPKQPDYLVLSHSLAHYHYLGWNGPVGESLAYLARDAKDRVLACIVFGAAAWKVQARDEFIGWDTATRSRRLRFIANNSRFLILPWVRVQHLASHILGLVLKRLSRDWQAHYGHPIYLTETYVERSRFKGTVYRASNWRLCGQTKGRSRQDRYFKLKLPIKDIYLYPLVHNFKDRLCRVEI